MVKVPSRVTTFVEMSKGSSINGTDHVLPLRHRELPGALRSASFELATCDVGETACSTTFSFGRHARLRLFRGEPATVAGVAGALRSLAASL